MNADYKALIAEVEREAQWGDKLAERVVKALIVFHTRLERAKHKLGQHAKYEARKQTAPGATDGATQSTCARCRSLRWSDARGLAKQERGGSVL